MWEGGGRGETLWSIKWSCRRWGGGVVDRDEAG